MFALLQQHVGTALNIVWARAISRSRFAFVQVLAGIGRHTFSFAFPWYVTIDESRGSTTVLATRACSVIRKTALLS
jgi:hypothetical protein